jgi:hypothetical protein
VSVGRAGARWVGAALLLARLLCTPSTAAATRSERPYDAPLAEIAAVPSPAPGDRERPPATRLPAPAPEITPEYASIEERGIKLVYHLHARERAHALLARALLVRAALAAELGRDVLGTVEIRVAAMPAQMASLAPPELPAGAPAAAFRDLHLVVMSLGSPLPQETADLEERLRHELAHLALDEAVAGKDLPRWLHEGFAIHTSGEDAAARAEALCLAALRDRLLGLRDVAARFPEGPPDGSLAAAEAADFVRFLAEPAQRPRFAALIERLREGKPFESALTTAYDGDLDSVERRVRREMARRDSFGPVLAGATALWMVVALGVVVRRRRRAARRAEAVGDRRAASLTRAAARLLSRDPPAPRMAEEEDDLALMVPPDPEVPKVEHDGRWYTLH